MKQLFLLMAFCSIPLASLGEEAFIGKKEAPITLIEYGSLTCDACNYFHRGVLPKITESYIEKGAVRYVYRHFPTGAEALLGAIATQCAGDQNYEMLDKLYLNVEHWYEAGNQNEIFVGYAESLNIDSVSFAQCLAGDQERAIILAGQQEASKKYGVIGTPTFVINGKVIKGKRSFSQMEALLDDTEPLGGLQVEQE